MEGLSTWSQAALGAVAARSTGGPVGRDLRITINFHPDRETAGRTILGALAHDGRLRSQFETGTSNGGLTAYPGGDRWRWESRIFDGAYDDAPTSARPVYGALDVDHRPLGAAPRFGSAVVRLHKDVLDRATFCFPDSALDPDTFGTAERFSRPAAARTAAGPGADPLDGYIEAQVHGGVRLPDDVEALVLDPCFRGTPVEHAARALGVPVEWHDGRVLSVESLREHADYRDPPALAAGEALAADGPIDALAIGRAVRAGEFDARALKQLWHLTAQWGEAREPGRGSR
ncbi:DUF3626 domain-containing protein [Actinomyces haliotis]|uniref:DUF3626 domain-containing protein n=1 Tax=Actinomyces haliotis TaxID=1280843 RepID=UPI00189061C9|nr:DUF3626 domain-containing protein [Actinomyces haliotis]